MFKDARAFSSFSADDIPAAMTFYSQTLGVQVSQEEDERDLLNLHLAGGGQVMIYPKADHTPATFTVLNFPVVSVEHAMGELMAHGVQFERYGGEYGTDERGIFTFGESKQAWFKDPAGNILSIIEST